MKSEVQYISATSKRPDLGDVVVGPQDKSVGAGEHGGSDATLDETMDEKDDRGEEEDALQ